MFSETIYQKATQELERIGFSDEKHILSDEVRKKDFLLQIATMVQYEVEITVELVERILSVIQMTYYG
jgi:hypothetical protein